MFSIKEKVKYANCLIIKTKFGDEKIMNKL